LLLLIELFLHSFHLLLMLFFHFLGRSLLSTLIVLHSLCNNISKTLHSSCLLS
jgi:hypothetical protein